MDNNLQFENKKISVSLSIKTMISLGILFNISTLVFFNIISPEKVSELWTFLLGVSLTLMLATLFYTWRKKLFSFEATMLQLSTLSTSILMFLNFFNDDYMWAVVVSFISMGILFTLDGKNVYQNVLKTQKDITE